MMAKLCTTDPQEIEIVEFRFNASLQVLHLPICIKIYKILLIINFIDDIDNGVIC